MKTRSCSWTFSGFSQPILEFRDSLPWDVEKRLNQSNIWQSYKQERGCLVNFLHYLALCGWVQSAWDNHARACDFAKYSLFWPTLQTETVHVAHLTGTLYTSAVADYSTTHTHTHTHPGLPGWASTRKVKPIWILLEQETVSGSGISWAIYKSAPRCRQYPTTQYHQWRKSNHSD